MFMNQDNTKFSDDWKACPPGTLTALSSQLTQKRRRAMIVKVTMLAAVVVGAIGIRQFIEHRDNQVIIYGGISCHDVRTQLAQWKRGQLDETTTEQINDHLKLCSSCAAHASALQARRQHRSDAADKFRPIHHPVVATMTPGLSGH